MKQRVGDLRGYQRDAFAVLPGQPVSGSDSLVCKRQRASMYQCVDAD